MLRRATPARHSVRVSYPWRSHCAFMIAFMFSLLQPGTTIVSTLWEPPVHLSPMKYPEIENIIVDEANQRTYVVMARRVLTDGEAYKAIRVELLKRGGKFPEPGQKLVITSNE